MRRQAAAVLLVVAACGGDRDAVPPSGTPRGPATTAPAGDSQRLELRIVALTRTVAAGGDAELTVRTAPNAAVTASVRYAGGALRRLPRQEAGPAGTTTWRWRVGRTAPAGVAVVVVDAEVVGRVVTTTGTFTVTRAQR